LNKFIFTYKQRIAGDFLSELLLQQLQERFDDVVSHYLIAKFIPKERPNTTKSYHN